MIPNTRRDKCFCRVSTIVLKDRVDGFAGADRFRSNPYVLLPIRLSITATRFFLLINFVGDELLFHSLNVGVPVVFSFVEGVYLSNWHSGRVRTFSFNYVESESSSPICCVSWNKSDFLYKHNTGLNQTWWFDTTRCAHACVRM